MLERKLYKTKLCILYQKGNCPRQSCSFAHGDAELRRYAGSLNGRRDYRSGDLRDRLDRRHSPHQRYSPGREARGRHAFHSHKLFPEDKGYSRSRSPVRRSDKRHRKKQDLGGESDVCGSPNASDVANDRIKEGKVSSYDERDVLEEQLKQTQLDVEMLDEQKSQLEIYLEEKVQEADKLSIKVEELEAQLNKEQEDCRRIASKIKKFTKVHGRYLRAQEELKRWQTRLHRLGDEPGLDTSKSGLNGEDSGINVVSDGELNGDNTTNHRHELHNYTSSIKKRLRLNISTSDETKAGVSRKRERLLDVSTRLDKVARGVGLNPLSDNNKEMEGENSILNKNNGLKVPADEHKHKRTKNSSSSIASLDKVKGPESGHLLPSTSMAAHAVDELIEAIEMENSEAVEAVVACENGSVDNRSGFPFLLPPPPTVTKNTHDQYEGDDEDVDVEEVDVEMGVVDTNGEAETERV